jgi:CRP/FNR family transcriptional regulator, nitrogen oxide reductase regulator
MPASGFAAQKRGLTPRFLEGLSPVNVKTVLAAATQRNCPVNAVIANQGHSANHLFLLTRGRARFFFLTPDGKKLLLHWLAPGDIVGAAALVLKPTPYLVSAEAVKETTLLVWTRAAIRHLALRFPLILENSLFITASDYLSWYVAAHSALISHTARERLARVVTYLARSTGQKVSGGVEIDVTNEELACASNITHFTASRILSEWRGHGALTKRRGKLLLLSPERLFHSAQSRKR